MSDETQETTPTRTPGGFVLRVLGLALLGLVLLNAGWAWLDPLPALGRVQLYNTLVPGRARLPYAEVPQRAYSVSIFDVDAMLRTHELAARPPDDAFRVLLIGDSSVWGFLLPADQTLAAYINAAGLTAPDGRPVRAYNLGYPILSVTKDLLILDKAMAYDPDMVIWFVTLESFPDEKQVFSPVVQENEAAVRSLMARYNLSMDRYASGFADRDLLDATLLGQRRAVADLLRLQLYGVMWAATGIDQDIPAEYALRSEDLSDETTYYGLAEGDLTADTLALDVLAAGQALLGEVPLLVVNEPMFVSAGENSDLRYNFFYPRWAYDDYRTIMANVTSDLGLPYLDAWRAVENDAFTDSPIHMTPAGTQALAGQVAAWLLAYAGD